jgi:hypothetical protein
MAARGGVADRWRRAGARRESSLPTLVPSDELRRAGWTYPKPLPGYEVLAGRVALYADDLTCTVGGEQVEPQAGGFYGGWITSRVVGPFKGSPGSRGW